MTPSIARLLVPIDFSAGSTRAGEYAVVLATALGASVHLLHVLEESFATEPSWEFYQAEVVARGDRVLPETRARLDAVAGGFSRNGVKATTEVRSGRPAREIVAVAASRGSDLIVMGTHGRSGLHHLLHGSVAEHVVRKAPCPVLAVCEPGVGYIPAMSAQPSAGMR